MKILNILFENILNPNGGLGVHVASIMSEIVKLGHEVTLLGYDSDNMEFSDTIYNGCRVVNCKNTNIQTDPKGAYYLLTLNDMLTENLLQHLKNEQFNIIALHDSLLWPIAKYAAILFGAPIVSFCHLSHALVHKQYLYTEQKQFEVTQEWHCYTQSHGVCTCSAAYEQELQEYFELDRNFTIIPNGIDFEKLQQYEYNTKLNIKLGDGKPVVGFVGRLVPSKGLELIINAIKACPDKYFIVISSIAPTVEDFVPLAKELKQLECNNFTWYKNLAFEEKWNIMASCDVAIMPSLHEPFGIVALEWAALRVHRILSTAGGLSEFNSFDNAIMIEPTKENLVAVLSHYHRDEYQKKQAEQLAKKMSWSVAAIKLEAEYLKVLNNVCKQ